MNRITIKFHHCHGIKKLETEIDFSDRVSCIYAPNGAMKTSFAKTFDDLRAGTETRDELFPQRMSIRSIEDENGNPLKPEEVFVIDPYQDHFESARMSTLLVNQNLKKEFDDLHETIEMAKSTLLKELSKVCGLKGEIEQEIASTFTGDPRKLYVALERVEKEVLDDSTSPWGKIPFKSIFNEKVIAFLETKDFQKQLVAYMEKYEQLLASSKFFRKGIFNHNNASVIAKNLSDNGFFKAKHSVFLNSGNKERKEVTTPQELEGVIEDEKNTILLNPELNAAFEQIDSRVKLNKELRDFREFISLNKDILPELSNLAHFRQQLWIAYLKQRKDQYRDFLSRYSEGKTRLASIAEEAKKEKTTWVDVIAIFNKRFAVPFTLTVENQDDVILRSELPSIQFTFKEVDDEIPVTRENLLRVLSNGEKRAYYLLNIIFEIEARKKERQRTVFVIDDVADSFDYKNKYAIIEYLKDLVEEDFFYQIVLTHNFDFFRTIQSRYIARKHCRMVNKTSTHIELVDAEYLKGFSHFRKHLENNENVFVACIPFVRNLIEYTKTDKDPDYLTLTSLLHMKPESLTLQIEQIRNIFATVLNQSIKLEQTDRSVLDVIFSQADALLKEKTVKVNLENKIVLAIAIRLKAEMFLIAAIADPVVISSITSNQTRKLFQIYKKLPGFSSQKAAVLDQVNLMTPENIHLNSFMYEPILDMSDDHLKTLYSDVKNL